MDAISSSIQETNDVNTAWLSSFTALPEMVQEWSADIPTMPHDELVTAQREDPTIAGIIYCKLEDDPPFEINRRSHLSYDRENPVERVGSFFLRRASN